MEKGWGKLTGHQQERVEQINPICSLQNGGSLPVNKNASFRRLNIQDRRKRRIFCNTTSKKLQKYVKLQRKVNLYEFLCPFFSLFSAPRIFTKLMKMPISLQRKLCLWIIICLDDMLLIRTTLEHIIIIHTWLV